MNKYFLTVFFWMLLWACNPARQQWEVLSPSGNLKTTITNQPSGLFYCVERQVNGKFETVLLPSPLGLVRKDASFVNHLTFLRAGEIKEVKDSYSMVTGKKRQFSYVAREQEFVFSNPEGKELTLVIRVFDEGMAFRYRMEGNDTALYTVVDEATGFTLPDSATGWMAPYELAKPWGAPGYEESYRQVTAGTPSPDSVGWAFPLLFHHGNHWILISEAGLNASYCGTHLKKNCSGGVYAIAFPQHEERFGDGEVHPVSYLPWTLPWRFVVVGDSLTDIFQSGMVYHLADPLKLQDTTWIRPGRASWEWWSSHGGRTVKRLKEFIDLAATMGWEYSLVDAGWEKMPDGTITEVIQYAKQKKVGLWLWYNSGGRRDSTQQSTDFVMFNPASRKAEMEKIAGWGIKGIKVDFFATDKQLAIQLYLDILRDAAEHHLMVNFHGCTLPRGWSRTYPNLLSMEAIRGSECYRFSETFPDMAPFYNTLAPVIRNVVGSADYTPAAFSHHRYPHKTTWAHELALVLLYESGIVHLCDVPEVFKKMPLEVKQLMKNFPVAWDDSRLIEAVPGKLLVVARKKGKQWYVAGINGEPKGKEICVRMPLSAAAGLCTLIADGETPETFSISTMKVTDTLHVSLKPYGGFVMY